MTEVIGGELGLPAAGQTRLRTGHDRRVIDQQVDPALRGEKTCGEAFDAAQIAQIQGLNLDLAGQIAERRQFISRVLYTACRHQHRGAGGGQSTRRLQTQTGIATGHDGGLSRQIDVRHGLHRGGISIEAGAYGSLRCGHGRWGIALVSTSFAF